MPDNETILSSKVKVLKKKQRTDVSGDAKRIAVLSLYTRIRSPIQEIVVKNCRIGRYIRESTYKLTQKKNVNKCHNTPRSN